MSASRLRRLDHVVLPVADLKAARTTFDALGFTVAPDAVHPFGTANACLFFADGAYIEPLGIADPALCEADAIAGNTFVAHDQAFRFRRGTPGFSGLAFVSEDAAADREAFERAGIVDGRPLEFRRIARAPDGSEAELGFRLVFARDRRAPDLSLFACEPIHRFKPDRSALTGHANGTTGIRRIIMSEPRPADFESFIQEAVGERLVSSDNGGFSIETGNVTMEIASPEGLRLRYGAARDADRGLRIEGLVLATDKLETVEDRCRTAGIVAQLFGERLVVRLGVESGAFIAFEAA